MVLCPFCEKEQLDYISEENCDPDLGQWQCPGCGSDFDGDEDEKVLIEFCLEPDLHPDFLYRL